MNRRNTVSFDEIFRFAEKHSGMDWNTCNRVFFADLLEYKGHKTLYREDIEGELTDSSLKLSELDRKARESLVAFMKEKRVQTLLVLGD